MLSEVWLCLLLVVSFRLRLLSLWHAHSRFFGGEGE